MKGLFTNPGANEAPELACIVKAVFKVAGLPYS